MFLYIFFLFDQPLIGILLLPAILMNSYPQGNTLRECFVQLTNQILEVVIYSDLPLSFFACFKYCEQKSSWRWTLNNDSHCGTAQIEDKLRHSHSEVAFDQTMRTSMTELQKKSCIEYFFEYNCPWLSFWWYFWHSNFFF